MTEVVQKMERISHNKKIVLDTDASYDAFSRFIEQQISEVKNDRSKANQALHRTGMYDANGCLKTEFS